MRALLRQSLRLEEAAVDDQAGRSVHDGLGRSGEAVMVISRRVPATTRRSSSARTIVPRQSASSA